MVSHLRLPITWTLLQGGRHTRSRVRRLHWHSPPRGAHHRRIVEVARKIASRIIEQASRIRVALTSCCPEAELLSLLALGLQRSGP